MMKSDQLQRGEEKTRVWGAFLSTLSVFAPVFYQIVIVRARKYGLQSDGHHW